MQNLADMHVCGTPDPPELLAEWGFMAYTPQHGLKSYQPLHVAEFVLIVLMQTLEGDARRWHPPIILATC
jgi:hypothetical protein